MCWTFTLVEFVNEIKSNLLEESQKEFNDLFCEK